MSVMPDVGLGNQVASIVSSFLLAHLSSRTLLLYWPPEMGHSWDKLKDHIEFPKSSSDLMWQYEDIVRLVADPVTLLRNSKRMLVNQETVITDPETVEALMCKNITTFMQDSQFVFLTSNVHFYRFLEINPIYANLISNVFEDRDVFGQIAKFLIRPRPTVRTVLNDFMNSNLPNRKYVDPSSIIATKHNDDTLVIGLHLRTWCSSTKREIFSIMSLTISVKLQEYHS